MLCSSCNSSKNKKEHSNLVPMLAPGQYQMSDSFTQRCSIRGLIWGDSAAGVRAAGCLHGVLPLNEWGGWRRGGGASGGPGPRGSSSQSRAVPRKRPLSQVGFDLRAPAPRLQPFPSAQASNRSRAATLTHGSWFWYPTAVLPGKSLPGEGRARRAAPAAGIGLPAPQGQVGSGGAAAGLSLQPQPCGAAGQEEDPLVCVCEEWRIYSFYLCGEDRAQEGDSSF